LTNEPSQHRYKCKQHKTLFFLKLSIYFQSRKSSNALHIVHRTHTVSHISQKNSLVSRMTEAGAKFSDSRVKTLGKHSIRIQGPPPNCSSELIPTAYKDWHSIRKSYITNKHTCVWGKCSWIYKFSAPG
jgi:hypothetical protein